jgi:hypothetical protein
MGAQHRRVVHSLRGMRSVLDGPVTAIDFLPFVSNFEVLLDKHVMR